MKYFKTILLIFLASIALTSQRPGDKDDVEADSTKVVGKSDLDGLSLLPVEEPVALAVPAARALLVYPKKVIFTNTNFPAYDIGCGSEGNICAVGINGKLFCYDFVTDSWDQVNANEEILNISAVDVDDDGKIYIIAQCGIYYLDCFDHWVKLPGTGKDIGVGVNFDVYKIGTDVSGSLSSKKNYGVWKLFCECDCNCTCSRICIRFRKLTLNICEPVIKKRCFWFRVDLYGTAVDVFPNGDAAVVRENGDVYIVDGKTLEVRKLLCYSYVKANDVTVGNDGVLYISTDSGSIMKFNFYKHIWEQVKEIEGKADRICASAYNILWYTKLDNIDYKKEIFTSARYDYLNFH